MTTVKPYQSPQAEAWRLKTATERAQLLATATDTLANLVADADKAKRVFNHLLEQAQHLDDSAMLTGATGESNELYNQARGKTLVLGTDDAQTLPLLAQVISALVTGNETVIIAPSQQPAMQEVVTALETASVPTEVVDTLLPTEQGKLLSDNRLAQVAVVGTVAQVQELSAQLSKTDAILTQVIAITDQDGLSEIFNPDYLHRFCTERVRTINTTAIGGNASLIELGVG